MTKKEEIINGFDPNGPGIAGNIFGLPFTPETAEVVLIPVPWEVTVSHRDGTALGPNAILEASLQVDHFMKDIPQVWTMGIVMLPIPEELYQENRNLRGLAASYIQSLSTEATEPNKMISARINEASENLNIYVKNTSLAHLDKGVVVGIVGGDHSTPLGLLRALGEKHERFGVLQIDAHADLRKAYEGFTCSHASIMYNALKIPAINRLVQIGTRDLCDEELNVIHRSMGRVKTFFDDDMKSAMAQGKTWAAICDEIIKELPSHVYISFDIDGLDPKLCPNTGTPVAGGFEFHEITFLLRQLVKSGKKIIGFDLNEVGPAAWDANVAARILYQLCNWTGVSQGKLKMTE